MQQILFHLPWTRAWMPPSGIPIYGFGAMLFLCFVLTAMVWGPRRAIRIGLPGERLQDLAILLFLTGIGGARAVYMIQYPDQFKDKNPFLAFFQIWEGGIVFYGSVIGGLIGYVIFHRLVLRKLKVSTAQLADVLAPLLALGLAIGRIGCYLNGCCWGQVAVPEVEPMPPIPIVLGQFPLIPSHSREQLTRPPLDSDTMPQIRGLQTTTGFTYDRNGVITAVEPGSEAARANLKKNDRIIRVNGEDYPRKTPQGEVDPLVEFVLDPHSESRLELVIDRQGESVPLSFVPRTVTFFPTQLYETASMLLLIGVLLTFQPFRRHDGQVMVLMMVGYAIHRFFNEAIRIEPTYALGFTLSQWISIFILLAAVGVELYLRQTQKPLPPGPQPLGYGATAQPVTA